jgi:hypothetical protein
MSSTRHVPPLTGAVSAYLPLCFMRDRARFDAYYTFEEASKSDFERWRSSLLWFLKKVGNLSHTALRLWFSQLPFTYSQAPSSRFAVIVSKRVWVMSYR